MKEFLQKWLEIGVVERMVTYNLSDVRHAVREEHMFMHEELNAYRDSLKEKIAQEVASEAFLDAVIDRIKRKQL